MSDDDSMAQLRVRFAEAFGPDMPIFPISALTGDGTRALTFAIAEHVERVRAARAPEQIDADDDFDAELRGEDSAAEGHSVSPDGTVYDAANLVELDEADLTGGPEDPA